MRRTYVPLQSTSVRALRWLVDERNGSAKGDALNMHLTGNRKGWVLMSVLRFLVRHGWAEVRDPEGTRNINKSEIFVTDAGRLWRDYIDWEPERLKLNRLELHARIRALEMALKPLARMHEQQLAAGCLTSSIASELEMQFAYNVLHSPHSGAVIYPWTPGFVGGTLNERTDAAGHIDSVDAAPAVDGTGERDTDRNGDV